MLFIFLTLIQKRCTPKIEGMDRRMVGWKMDDQMNKWMDMWEGGWVEWMDGGWSL